MCYFQVARRSGYTEINDLGGITYAVTLVFI